MKIVLDSSQQTLNENPDQQQYVIIQSQSQANKQKQQASSSASEDIDADDPNSEEVVYVLKEEHSDNNVITLDSTNCVNEEQFVWIAGEQGDQQAPTTMYTIKELNYSQVINN